MNVNAVQSMYAVFLLGFGGLVEPGGSLSQVFIVILTMLGLPAGEHSHLVAAVCTNFAVFSTAHFAFIFALSAVF
jgi:hypothetical protein